MTDARGQKCDASVAVSISGASPAMYALETGCEDAAALRNNGREAQPVQVDVSKLEGGRRLVDVKAVFEFGELNDYVSYRGKA